MKRFLRPALAAAACLAFAYYLFDANALLYAAARPDAGTWLKLIAPHAPVIFTVACAAAILCCGIALGRIGYVRKHCVQRVFGSTRAPSGNSAWY